MPDRPAAARGCRKVAPSGAKAGAARRAAGWPPGRKRRIAILGGGQAALTAALALTDPRNPHSADVEVTVHQLGWRLGGKGTTGRPTDRPWAAHRIQEHGLHNWFGFYDNAFAGMRTVYEELGRPPGAPLATFEEAFQGANEAVFVEQIEGQPRLWTIHNLTNDAEPGIGGLELSPWTYVEMALEALERMLGGGSAGSAANAAADHPVVGAVHAAAVDVGVNRPGDGRPDLGAGPTTGAAVLLATARRLAGQAPPKQGPLGGFLSGVESEVARHLGAAAGVPGWIRAIEHAGYRAVTIVMWLFMTLIWEAVHENLETAAKDDERRFWIMANLGYATITGAMIDGVFENGFDSINDQDFRAWLGKHLYPDGGIAMRSPVLEAVYTAAFAYPGGDAFTPRGGSNPPAENIEAGTTLRGMIRTAFTYKGSFAYRFAAGTADTCYAPTYEVLLRRGVRFEFFHRVDRLVLGAGGKIAKVVIGRQARTQVGPGGGSASYRPLIDVDGLPCWPDQPGWRQLEDGDWFRGVQADFENPTAEVRAREVKLELVAGAHYDDVVLGISIASLPSIAAEVVAASPAWQAAVREVKTVRTQAFQAWLTHSGPDLGFDVPRNPIVTWLYDGWSPLNVLGDYTELIGAEGWPAGSTPQFLGYFCSTMPDAGADPFDPFPDQVAANARVRSNAVELLNRGVWMILPGATAGSVGGAGTAGSGGGAATAGGRFDWSLLMDPRPSPGVGEARLDSQFWQANVAPSERYVLSVVGSSRFRLPAHDAAFPNLYLAGDWTWCNLNAGCMEAATISGLLCSNALVGYPARSAIVGVDF